jgi:hypothetical protein
MSAPRPTPRDFAILGKPDRAPLAECIQSYERLAAKFDPRHRPPDEQDAWITYQNALDESLALVHDAERWAGAA